MPPSIRRIVAVTLGLSAIGAVVGGVLGIGAMLFIGLVGTGTHLVPPIASFLPIAAVIGSCAGAALAPVAAWTLMRRVPIWKAIAGTALGTTFGVVAGYLLGGAYDGGLSWLFIGGFLGFLVAALVLRLRGSERVAPVGDVSGGEPV